MGCEEAGGDGLFSPPGSQGSGYSPCQQGTGCERAERHYLVRKGGDWFGSEPPESPRSSVKVSGGGGACPQIHRGSLLPPFEHGFRLCGNTGAWSPALPAGSHHTACGTLDLFLSSSFHRSSYFKSLPTTLASLILQHVGGHSSMGAFPSPSHTPGSPRQQLAGSRRKFLCLYK